MKTWIKWGVPALVLSAALHLLIVATLPYAIMLVLKLSTDHTPNTIFHNPPVTADSREVVRPSPDLLYSGCPFNLSDGPLRVTAPVSETYYSVSAFAENTDNFFAINDRQMKGQPLRLVVVGPGQQYQAKAGERVVQSPTTLGTMIFRMLITDRKKLAALQAVQRKANCQTVK